jgi:hypothetical protein
MARPVVKSTDAETIQPWVKIQDAEWDSIFLHVSRQGSLAASIRASIGERRASAVYHAIRRDLELQARLASAESEFREGLLSELVRRGRDGVDTPHFHKSEIVAYVKTYSDAALLAACRHYVSTWLDKRSASDVSHHVTLEEAPGAVALIAVEDLACLDQSEKRQMAALIRKIQAARNAAAATERELAQIEHHPEAVDTGYEEVANDPYDLRELADINGSA